MLRSPWFIHQWLILVTSYSKVSYSLQRSRIHCLIYIIFTGYGILKLGSLILNYMALLVVIRGATFFPWASYWSWVNPNPNLRCWEFATRCKYLLLLFPVIFQIADSSNVGSANLQNCSHRLSKRMVHFDVYLFAVQNICGVFNTAIEIPIPLIRTFSSCLPFLIHYLVEWTAIGWAYNMPKEFWSPMQNYLFMSYVHWCKKGFSFLSLMRWALLTDKVFFVLLLLHKCYQLSCHFDFYVFLLFLILKFLLKASPICFFLKGKEPYMLIC